MVIVRCLRDGDDFYNMGDWVSIQKKDTSEWISGQLGYIGTKKFDVITTEWHKDHPNDLVHRHSREIRSNDVECVIKINQLFDTNYNAACTKIALESIRERNL